MTPLTPEEIIALEEQERYRISVFLKNVIYFVVAALVLYACVWGAMAL